MAKSSTKSTRNQIERCSFCGKTRRQVESLIAGPPGVYICNECIDLCNTILQEQQQKERIESKSGESFELDPENLPIPQKIKSELDLYIVGQEEAKKVLAVSVYNHYRRILATREQTDSQDQDIILEKSNILLVGPTGSGKTLLAQTLAKFLNVPFAIGDATTLTEAGYVGEDVENLLLKLLQAADFNVQKAERGIIFLDEIDKIGRTQNNVSITRDVSGEGVQQSLLKMLEGVVANVPPQGGRKHPEQAYIQIDTSKILFICGGTFVGLNDIIERRVGKTTIGFHGTLSSESDKDSKEKTGEKFLPRVEPEDLVHFGIIPELIGRLPVISALEELDVEALTKVLTEPRNALVKQYKKLFELEGAELEFSHEALVAIAHKAVERKTGARGLRAVIEAFMLNALFELPGQKSRSGVRRYRVEPEIVRGNASLLDSFEELQALETQDKSQSDRDKTLRESA